MTRLWREVAPLIGVAALCGLFLWMATGQAVWS